MKNKICKRIALVGSLLAVPAPVLANDNVEIHLSILGQDDQDGAADRPVRTLQRAQELVREKLSNAPGHSINVWIHKGTYYQPECLILGNQDSGTPEHPVHWKAWDGEQVVISGGMPCERIDIPTKLADALPANVKWRVSAWKVGREQIGYHQHQWSHNTYAKVLAGESYLTPARWPDLGWHRQHSESGVLDFKDFDHLLAPGDSAWLHGFLHHHWDADFYPFSWSDENKWTVELTDATPLTEAVAFRVVHTLSALNETGEWYFDNDSETLLAISPNDDQVEINVTNSLLAFEKAAHIHWTGINFRQASDMAIEIAESEEIELNDCTITGVNDTGIHVYGGQSNIISNCVISNTGRFGVRVEAGNRSTLAPADHLIRDCTITEFGRQHIGFSAGIYLAGVGTTASNNRITEGSDAGIRIEGNDHIVRGNEIGFVCQDVHDSGAIHLGHDLLERGNIIRDNYIYVVGDQGEHTIGIFLDDFASGTVVQNNILNKVGRGIAIAGGFDNIVQQNVMSECMFAIQLDTRERFSNGMTVREFLNHVREKGEYTVDQIDEYVKAYPGLANIIDATSDDANGNVISQNIVFGNSNIYVSPGLENQENLITENYSGKALPEVDPAGLPVILTNLASIQNIIEGYASWNRIGPVTVPSVFVQSKLSELESESVE